MGINWWVLAVCRWFLYLFSFFVHAKPFREVLEFRTYRGGGRELTGLFITRTKYFIKVHQPFIFFFFFKLSLVICFTFSFHVHRKAQFIVKACRDSEKSLWEQGGPDLPNLGLVTVPWNLFISLDHSFFVGLKNLGIWARVVWFYLRNPEVEYGLVEIARIVVSVRYAENS